MLTKRKSRTKKPSEPEIPLPRPPSVGEIIINIASQSRLNFDYLTMTLVASVVAGLGLATNNVVAIIAAMIISPLMGPILAGSLGVIVHFRKLIWQGLINEFVGLAVCGVIGMLLGFVLFPLGAILGWPSPEMQLRGQVDGFISSMAIAIASGVGVGISVTNNQIAPLVGIGIAASLLPPIVNFGITFAYGLVGPYYFRNDTIYLNRHQITMESLLTLSAISLALALGNIFFIFVFSMITFKLKALKPLGTKYAIELAAPQRDFWRDLTHVDRDRMERLYRLQARRNSSFLDEAVLRALNVPPLRQRQQKQPPAELQEEPQRDLDADIEHSEQPPEPSVPESIKKYRFPEPPRKDGAEETRGPQVHFEEPRGELGEEKGGEPGEEKDDKEAGEKKKDGDQLEEIKIQEEEKKQ